MPEDPYLEWLYPFALTSELKLPDWVVPSLPIVAMLYIREFLTGLKFERFSM